MPQRRSDQRMLPPTVPAMTTWNAMIPGVRYSR